MPDTDRNTPTAAPAAEAPAHPTVAPALLPNALPAPSVGPLPPLLVPSARAPLMAPRHAPQHGAYLAASGTLTQFNALIAAMLTAALASIERPPLRAAVGLALIAHTCAAFLLCWAARPRAEEGSSGEDMAADTFKSYRRGWRVTMLAMFLSAVALAIFSFDTLGGAGLLHSLMTR